MSNVKHTRSAASLVPAPADPSQGAGRADDVTQTRATVRPAPRGHIGALPAPVIFGVIVGAIQAASPLGFWWLAPRAVYALGLAFIAAVYVGFSVADGRWRVIAAESSVAGLFVVIAAISVSGSAWLLVLGMAGHGLKDLWQHRTQFVRNTRWWPPFCATVDWAVAGILTTAILMGVPFHG